MAMAGSSSVLAAGNWHQRWRGFAAECEESTPAEEADRIREAWTLCRLAPAGMRALFAGLPAASRVEGLLAADAAESAALALVGPGMGYMLSRGGHGVALASLVLRQGEADHSAEGATLALALLSALARALAAAGEGPAGQGARLN